MLNQAAFAVAAFRRGFGRIDPEELRYGAEISIWVRWFGVVVCLVIVTYQGDHSEFSYLLDILYHLVPVAVNGYVHYRIRTNRAVTWYWLLALSVMDLAQASIGTAITGGFVSPFFVFCFPAVSVFASVFTSPRIIFSWTTLVAAIYTGLCLAVAPGLDFDGAGRGGPVRQAGRPVFRLGDRQPDYQVGADPPESGGGAGTGAAAGAHRAVEVHS